MSDDELESLTPLFLQRFRNGEVSEKAARSMLDLAKLRLNFLQALSQSTTGIEEFRSQDAYVKADIEEQAREIREFEHLLEERDRNSPEDFE